MKKMVIAQIVVLTILVALLFVGCTTKVVMTAPSVPATTSIADDTNTADTIPFEWTDRMYLDFVRETYPSQDTVSDSTTIDLAHSICDFLDNGGSVNEVAGMIVKAQADSDLSDSTTKDMAEVIGAGITAFCPQYQTN